MLQDWPDVCCTASAMRKLCLLSRARASSRRPRAPRPRRAPRRPPPRRWLRPACRPRPSDNAPRAACRKATPRRRRDAPRETDRRMRRLAEQRLEGRIAFGLGVLAIDLGRRRFRIRAEIGASPDRFDRALQQGFVTRMEIRHRLLLDRSQHAGYVFIIDQSAGQSKVTPGGGEDQGERHGCRGRRFSSIGPSGTAR